MSETSQLQTEQTTENHQAAQNTETLRVITVRVPKSLHQSLKDQAEAHGTSMNQLCIAKLLMEIERLNEDSIT